VWLAGLGNAVVGGSVRGRVVYSANFDILKEFARGCEAGVLGIFPIVRRGVVVAFLVDVNCAV